MNLYQMTITSTTVGKIPLEEMEQPTWLTEESEIQYLGADSKITEWSKFVLKAKIMILHHSNSSLRPNH